jgi:exonuclease VII large subunit
MKKTNLTFLILMIAMLSFGQTEQTNTDNKSDIPLISASEAPNYIDKEVKVKAKVISTFFSEKSKGKPTYLNLDKKFPDNPMTVVIFESKLKELKINPKNYEGKTIIVKGKIKLWASASGKKYSIIINNQKQIEIVD